MPISDILAFDVAAETQRIVEGLQSTVRRVLRRRGAVLGLSGGVDSSVTLALCVRAFGRENVFTVFMPERDSSPDTAAYVAEVATHYGIAPLLEDITPALEGLQCYARRDAAVRSVFPDYSPEQGDKIRVTLPHDLLEGGTLNVFVLTIVRADGSERSARLASRELLQIVAASNLKQRTRMSFLYYHAERQYFAVIGTANKNERDQGFFVKHGDDAVDVQPIAHLYKTQVYELAAHLGVPESVRSRTPTSDTYSAPTSQEEFFFRLPFSLMDLLCHAHDNNVPLRDVAEMTGLDTRQIERAFEDFRQKRRSAAYLHTAPLMVASEPVRLRTDARASGGD